MVNDDSLTQSLSSADEDPENTLNYWKQKYKELEVKLQEMHVSAPLPSNDIEIQCSMIEDKPKDDLNEMIEKLKIENEELQARTNQLKEEISNLNFRISSISIQPSTTADVN